MLGLLVVIYVSGIQAIRAQIYIGCAGSASTAQLRQAYSPRFRALISFFDRSEAEI